MSELLYRWLSDEWKNSNHPKYYMYFKVWIDNLTNDQINGFDKMRTSDFIIKN